MNKISVQVRTLIKSLPSIPVYFYLLVLTAASTAVFIFLLTIVQWN